MNESSINSIGNVRAVESSPPPKAQVSAPEFTLVQQTESVVSLRPAPVAQETPQAQLENMASQAANSSNVSIHFRVDEKTSEVTIFVVDRKSKKVLRSIPASEMQKIQVGELLKLVA